MNEKTAGRPSGRGGPRIVAIGGGTGLSTMLRGLKSCTENVTAIAAYVAKVNRAVPLELINFNPLCISKYETLRQDYIPTDGKPLPPAEMARFAEIVKAQGLYVKY